MAVRLRPTSVEELVDAVREHPRVTARGAGTKRPLHVASADFDVIDTSAFAGVTEYEPDEYTFTARAGTKLAEIEALLAAHGQHMPFDPPLAREGATLGGTLAAGLNGPGRLRYGGLRDFVIGVRLVDGTGRLIRGGGKVVKNAAGFDLPKLMVGSMGRLGIIADLTFKIFPAPQVRATLRVSCRNLGEAVRTIVDLMRRPLDIEALDLEPPGTLYIRVAGDESGLATHARRVGEATNVAFDILDDPAAAEYWRKQLSFSWLPADAWLVKVPMTPRDIVAFDAALPSGVARRYSVGGNVAWAAWPARDPIPATAFEHRAGLIVRGPAAASAFVGRPTGRTFAGLVKRALDPDARFPALS